MSSCSAASLQTLPFRLTSVDSRLALALALAFRVSYGCDSTISSPSSATSRPPNTPSPTSAFSSTAVQIFAPSVPAHHFSIPPLAPASSSSSRTHRQHKWSRALAGRWRFESASGRYAAHLEALAVPTRPSFLHAHATLVPASRRANPAFANSSLPDIPSRL
ncbi:hypothetical protein C8F01DRAFT_703583 [Mycena amicta]|nr:hypothetical protein C8F01DRAFT_703583 [Mycena amicta]